MKARVKATGETVEVEQLTRTTAICHANGKIYHKLQLDFNLDPPQPEATISGWMARDEDGELSLFPTRPLRDNECWYGDEWWTGVCKDLGHIILDSDLFPSLTWQDEPLEVEITIKPKKIC